MNCYSLAMHGFRSCVGGFLFLSGKGARPVSAFFVILKLNIINYTSVNSNAHH